jgi:tetratricopeptide (TPR) repeat protein
LLRAVALAGDKADAWVALVQYQVRTGQRAKAEATIEAAKGKFPKDQAALALAQCYEVLGNLDQARKQYQAALAATEHDQAALPANQQDQARERYLAALQAVAKFYLRQDDLKEAGPYLQKIVALKPFSPQEAKWAQRVLHYVLAVKGNYQQAQQALEDMRILEETGPQAPSGDDIIEEQRVHALALAQQKGRKPRREAIRLLEAVNEREPLVGDDRLLLARLYEADGDWPRARERMVSVLRAQPENPLYLSSYARSLVSRKEFREAENLLAKLEKVEAGSWRTLEIKARVLRGENRAAEAVALLKAYAQTHEADVGFVAALLDDLGQAPAAEEMYRKFVSLSKKPESALVLAGFLGRQHRLAEALNECEAAWRTCPPELVAQACLLILHAGNATDEHCRRVAGWLESAPEKHPAHRAMFLLQLGTLRNLQGRYADVEALFRKVLEQDPENALGLNNLACLLALEGKGGAEALDLANRAIACTGPLPSLLDTRGLAYLTLGQTEQAIRDLQESAAETRKASTYFHLAQAHLLAKNRGAAKDALQKAKAAGLKDSDLHPLERPAYQDLLEAIKQGETAVSRPRR